jgi:superfamily I DNA/RNA helicase
MQPPKAIACLIKEDGTPFSASEIRESISQLDVLTAEQRIAFRNSNAKAIAEHTAPKMLIVSGPGTGKSYLFLDKIRAWLDAHSDKTILVTSFVRKLVADLKTDVENKLAAEHSPEVTVWTLHRLARSIVERNHGSSTRVFRPHLKIITGPWQGVVWTDVLLFHPALNHPTHKWRELEKQFHNDSYLDEEAWKALRGTYFALSQFYNAAGFADLIIAHAKHWKKTGLWSETSFSS